MNPSLSRTVAGFTLIEVLVALTIVSLCLAVIFALFSGGLRSRRTADDYEQATLLAEAKLNSVGVEEPLQPGSTYGSFNDRFRWKAIVTPYNEKDSGAEATNWVRQPFVVAVTVYWGHAGDEKSVALKTLRLKPR
jgi:general secretion pathway protein I